MTTDDEFAGSEEGRWVTINEAAAITGRHPNTIRNWVREGRFSHVGEEPHPGGIRYLLAEDEVMTMMAIPAQSDARPKTRGDWDRLAAQLRRAADVVGEVAELQRRVAEAEAEVARLEEENRLLRKALEEGG